MRRDSPEHIYRKLANPMWPDALPADAELARRYGDTRRRKVYPHLKPLRRKWLEAWKLERGIEWLPQL